MDSDKLITAMKEIYDYFHDWQQSVITSEVLTSKYYSPEEKAIVQADMRYTEGAKDTLRMLARELELNVDYNTLEKK